ncbi:MAG: fatty acid desaturase CarF family protein, partial [Myxococcota bacterium]
MSEVQHVSPAVGAHISAPVPPKFDFESWADRLMEALAEPPKTHPETVERVKLLRELGREAQHAEGPEPWKNAPALTPSEVKKRDALLERLNQVVTDYRFPNKLRSRLAETRYRWALVEHDPLERELFINKQVRLDSASATDDQWEAPPLSTRPTVRDVFQDPRNLKNGVPYAFTVGGQALATGALLAVAATQVESAPQALKALMLLWAGWEAADAIGYVLHAVVDQVDPKRAPKALKADAENFQFHHHEPTNILKRDSLEMMDRIAVFGLPAVAVVTALNPPLGVACFVAGLASGALLSMESHKQSHTPTDRVPAWGKAMQRLG